MPRRQLKIELDSSELALVESIQMPSEIPVITKDLSNEEEQLKQALRSPFLPRARWLRPHESKDERLSWWNYPGQGEVLLFDPHRLTVAEMQEYLPKIRNFAQHRVIYILHGGDGQNPLSLVVQEFFGRKFSLVNFNRGLSKIDLRRS